MSIVSQTVTEFAAQCKRQRRHWRARFREGFAIKANSIAPLSLAFSGRNP